MQGYGDFTTFRRVSRFFKITFPHSFVLIYTRNGEVLPRRRGTLILSSPFLSFPFPSLLVLARVSTAKQRRRNG